METELTTALATVSAAALALAAMLVKSMRSGGDPGPVPMTPFQQEMLVEFRAMNGALGRIETHQEAFAASQARTAEALAYWKGRMDAAPTQAQ